MSAKCPHTMKAEDRDGTVYCCDCGKTIRKPKPERPQPPVSVPAVREGR
jgi:uncharacterized Zn finger protein (UPF0148 family)